MKTYVIITGTIFGLLTLAHVWRVVGEHSSLATDPWYVLITAAAAAMCVWAFRLVLRAPAS